MNRTSFHLTLTVRDVQLPEKELLERGRSVHFFYLRAVEHCDLLFTASKLLALFKFFSCVLHGPPGDDDDALGQGLLDEEHQHALGQVFHDIVRVTASS